jgi:hypothetical protein
MTSVTLNIDSETDQALTYIANRQGVTRDQYLHSVIQQAALSAKIASQASSKPITGVDVLAALEANNAFYLKGKADDPAEFSHQLREQSQRRDLQ